MRHIFVKNILILSLMFLSCCTNNVTQHGIVIAAENLEKIALSSEKSYVRQALGPPSIISSRNDQEIWFYVNYQKNKQPLKKSQLIDYKIIEIALTDDKISNIAQYDLNNISNIKFNKNQTASQTKKQNIFRDILQNMGKFQGSSDL